MFDVIIVGGGVAAFSAALFAARRGLKTLVIGKDVAGQANFTDLIENFPGIEEIGGFELVSAIRGQAEKFGAEFLQAEVSKIKAAGDSFVAAAYGKQYKAQSIILAYGKTPLDLAVPGEQELKGKGVSYCATCDGPLFKNKIVAIAGIGDIAADAGLVSAKFAQKVYVLSKTDKLVAHPALIKALFKKKNVELLSFVQIQQLLGENKLTGMELLDLKTGKQRQLPVDGLLVELGYVVDSQMARNIVKLDEREQIVINSDQSTSVPGIFAAGDATSRPYKQAVISAGEGAAAALACYDWLMRRQGNIGLTSDWTKIKKLK
jgi:thioredoxin reductase (NADPH)